MSERIGFKVVTENMQSLGLRRNSNILTYPVGEWYKLPEDWIIEGSGDWGGIWVARNKGGANTLKKYMKDHYGRDVLVFEAQIGRVLYENSYRIKTDSVFLIKDIEK